MSDRAKLRTRALREISRRESLFLLPAGAMTAGWLIGCGGDESTPGGVSETPMAGAGTPTAGTPSAGAPADGSGTAGTPATATAGASAGASGGAAGATGGAGSSATAAGAGGSTITAGSMAAPAAGGGGSAMPGAGAGGSMMSMAGTGGNNQGTAGPNVPWATGGTKSMQGGYPDPFEMGMLGTACRIYPSQTLGPCYAMMAPMVREDISDAMPGLPLRLSFLVVRSGCMPVADAEVDIWHSGFDGVYSAYATGTICNPGTASTQGKMFGRGIQKTNAMGRVDFSTIFPGWYRGRTIHIHFTVRVGGRATVTSQLYFEDSLANEIMAQGEYKARGQRDTTNMDDSTFRSGGAMPDQIVMMSAKRPDGVLHAWKVLSIGS